ncbi:MAG: MBL fold metallo-hydrolase [Defluviitaleaceae bacterium]|nr:MBL fold metallo-hydrolase [Defluviitaleaceae bacterium]
MKIADNVAVLEIKDERGAYCPTLVWDENEVILIDTGLPGQLDLIRAAMEPLGFKPEDITKVIITHQDMDHIGCVNELRALGAKALAHKDEVPYLEGELMPVRLADMAEDIEKHGSNWSGEREYFEKAKADAPKYYIKVDRKLSDREYLDCCGGIEIIHTPGHMPGHIALHLLKDNIIVAGDAANIIHDKFIGPNPVFTNQERMPQANESFEKIRSLRPKMIVCFHGGIHFEK